MDWPEAMPPQPPAIFDCWKEIASYLGKSVRTVQRWEREFGLPVQRPDAGSKGLVRVTREELDRWVAARWSQRSETSQAAIPIRRRQKSMIKDAIQTSRQLRATLHSLVIDFRKSVGSLSQSCKELRALRNEPQPKQKARTAGK